MFQFFFIYQLPKNCFYGSQRKWNYFLLDVTKRGGVWKFDKCLFLFFKASLMARYVSSAQINTNDIIPPFYNFIGISQIYIYGYGKSNKLVRLRHVNKQFLGPLILSVRSGIFPGVLPMLWPFCYILHFSKKHKNSNKYSVIFFLRNALCCLF